MKRLLVVGFFLFFQVTMVSAISDVLDGGGDTGVVCEQAVSCGDQQQANSVGGALSTTLVGEDAVGANNETDSGEIDRDDDDTWLAKHGHLLAWAAVAAAGTALGCWAIYQWWLKPSWVAELEAERQRAAAAQQQANDADQRSLVAQRAAQQELAQRIAAQDIAAAAQLVARTASTAEQAVRAEVGAQLAGLRTNVTDAFQHAVRAEEEKTMLTQEVRAVREAAHVGDVARLASETRANALAQQLEQVAARLADTQNQVQKAEEAVKKAVESGDKDAKDMLMASVVYGHLLNLEQHFTGDMKGVEKEYKVAENEFRQMIKRALATYTITSGEKIRGFETLDQLVRAKLRQFLLLDFGLEDTFWQLLPDQRTQRMNDALAEFLSPADDEKVSSQKQLMTLAEVDREIDIQLRAVCQLRLWQYINQARCAGASALIGGLEKQYGKGT